MTQEGFHEGISGSEILACAETFIENLGERLDYEGFLRHRDLSPTGTFVPSRIMTAEQFKQTHPDAGELIDSLGLWVVFDWTGTWYRLVVLVSALAGHHDLTLFAATRLVSGVRNRELTPPRRILRGHPFGRRLSIEEDQRPFVIDGIAEAIHDYRSEYRHTRGGQ